MGFKLEAATNRDRGFEPQHRRAFTFFVCFFLPNFQLLLVLQKEIKTQNKKIKKEPNKGKNRYHEIHEENLNLERKGKDFQTGTALKSDSTQC